MILAIFGDFRGREPNSYCDISYFDFLSVSFDFLFEITLPAINFEIFLAQNDQKCQFRAKCGRFWAKILILIGESKSFGTHITEKTT